MNSKVSFQLIIFSFCSILFFFGCTEDEPTKKVFELGQVTDIDGNNYQTVKIGDQWWMKEDLKVKNLNSGNPIKFYSEFEASEWANSRIPGYSNGVTGLIYNFYAVRSIEKIAPLGWHVATDADWQKLEAHLGMTNNELNEINWRGKNEGDKLKQDYQESGWVAFNDVWGTNESGFTALACGCRLFDGRPCSPTNAKQGFWWTSTPFENKGWFRNLDYKKSGVLRYFEDANYGFAIRCVKD